MATNLDKAFEVDAIVIGELVGIVAGVDDPTISGQTAPLGSLYLRTNGDIFKKAGAGNIDWEVLEATTQTLTSTNEYKGHVNVAVNYNATDKVIILVDSTAQAVTISLPDAATYLNKIFHVKWKAGNNLVSISAQAGQNIDGDQVHIMGDLYDSLEFISDGSDWFIV